MGDLAVVAWPTLVTFLLGGALVLIELAGPVLGESKDGGTPWHAHHIAERHSLFAIVALGEGIVGTVAALSSVVAQNGWTMETALVGVAGTGLTFGIWWIYDLLPSARILHAHRNRAFAWSFGQIAIVASIVAIGAGLHVAAHLIAHEGSVSRIATALSVAVPVGACLVATYAVYGYLVGRWDRFGVGLLLTSTGVVVAAVVAAASGLSLAGSLLILALAPTVTVVGYERLGYRYKAAALAHNARET